MLNAEQAWKLLTNSVGQYFGTGRNHQGLQFESRSIISLEIPNKLISFKFKVLGSNSELYHDEISWIGYNDRGELNLIVNSTNHSGMTIHQYYKLETSNLGSRKIIFKYGIENDLNTFREEITFLIHKNYNLEHYYSRGTPGHPMTLKTVSKFNKLNKTTILTSTNEIESDIV